MPPPGRMKLGEQAKAVVPLVAFMLTKSFGLPIAYACAFVSATVRKVLWLRCWTEV